MNKKFSFVSRQKIKNTTGLPSLDKQLCQERHFLPLWGIIIPIELSRYNEYSLKRRAELRVELKSIKRKPSPHVQGGMEIPIEVTVQYENGWAREILRRLKRLAMLPWETDQREDQSKDILNSVLKEDRDSETLIEQVLAGEVLLLK